MHKGTREVYPGIKLSVPKGTGHTPSKGAPKDKVNVLEYKLMHVDGQRSDGSSEGGGSGEGAESGSEEGAESERQEHGTDDYPLLLRTSACAHIPKEDVAVLHEMWAHTDVVLEYGGPPAGLQMRHCDLERLLNMGGSTVG